MKKILILIALVSFLVFLATANAGLIGGEQGGPSAASVLEPHKDAAAGCGVDRFGWLRKKKVSKVV